MTHKEAIIETLKVLGGHAYLKDIYKKFSDIYDSELGMVYSDCHSMIHKRKLG